MAATDRPVILDTDIGDDIDDTWALLVLLRLPQLNLKLAVGDFGKPLYRARLLARLLELTGRHDVAVGIGVPFTPDPSVRTGDQSAWLGDYALDQYPGVVHEDGVQAIIDTISTSVEPVTLLCLGPVPNIAEALRREPSIADNAVFVGMFGSIHEGYAGAPEPVAEYNVRMDPGSLRFVFDASWECSITPLDSCGHVVLDGEGYRRLHRSRDPGLRALMDNYRAWLPGAPYIAADHDLRAASTTLFDCAAVHLAAGGELLVTQTLPLTVTDDGFTRIDYDRGRPVRCALAWKDLAAFEKQLVDTLLGSRDPQLSTQHREATPPPHRSRKSP